MIGEEVTIVKSLALAELKLIPLVGLKGTIVKEFPNNKTPGATVRLYKSYMREKVWYIPIASIKNATQMEELNKQDLINSMKL